MLIFFIPKGHFTRSHQLRKVTPSPASECAPPWTKGGGDTLSCGWGGDRARESQFRRLEKSLALCLLCAIYKRNIKSTKWILMYSIQCTQKLLIEWLCGILPLHRKFEIIIPRKETARPRSAFMYPWAIYIFPMIGPTILLYCVCGPIVHGIRKSLTDTWM
jgi:hypothetical protein